MLKTFPLGEQKKGSQMSLHEPEFKNQTNENMAGSEVETVVFMCVLD
jgi:hypothetical protein